MNYSVQKRIFTSFGEWFYNRVPKDKTIECVDIDGELHPVYFMGGKNETFIFGRGYIKIGKKKRTVLPYITDETDIQKYLNVYGKYCTFYMLTGQLFNTKDCCYQRNMDDFIAMEFLGVDVWMEFMDRFHKLKSEINDIYLEKYGIIPDNDTLQTTKNGTITFRDNLFTLSIQHYLLYPFRSKPHFDVIEDDKRLERTFFVCEKNKDFTVDCSEFPESMVDRLTYLFNENVSNEYGELMTYFGL